MGVVGSNMRIIAILSLLLLWVIQIAHCAIDSDFQAPWGQHLFVNGMYLLILITLWLK